MHPLEGLLFLLALHAGLVLSGYWLTVRLEEATPGERLAVAILAGLASLLLLVAGVNFFLPLSGLGAALCLVPAAGSLAYARSRSLLWADARSLFGSRTNRLVAVLYVVFLAWLLRPALVDGHSLFYDGTSNHDSFIWITSGEYLQQHSYMDQPVESATQPWLNTAGANIGWHPSWGRMGAEGLIALASSLAFTGSLNTYLYSTAALYLPWTAAVFLAAVTFYRRTLSPGALAALVTLQPVFIFFYANSNLPNLVGTIAGATTVIATEMALRAENGRQRTVWCALLALALHGLYASYPEMTPFVLLPCGLLWVRSWFTRPPALTAPRALAVASAFLAGSVINPATSFRAWNGFISSFRTAREDHSWANLFEPLRYAEYVPGLATLSVSAAKHLGLILGLGLTLVLLVTGLLSWWRARDRFGAAAALAGSGALLAYTLATGFTYGWQKTTQFGGIFIAAAVPVVLLDTQLDFLRQAGWRRWLAGVGLASILCFHAAATKQNFGEISTWSRDKILSLDWFDLRNASRTTLQEAPVLIDAPTFRMPFFHGMWSTYFLPASRVYFSQRGVENGGYLRERVLKEDAIPAGRPPVVLVGRKWAETFDANSTRLQAGREYALLQEANRVAKMEGVYPLNGVPEHASTHATLEITPHSPSRLHLTLAPYLKKNWPRADWRISYRVGDGPENTLTLSGVPPWQFAVPLVAHQANLIEFTTVAPAGNTEILPFAIRVLKIESVP